MLFGKKAQVMRELRSGDVIAVRQALDECRANGWHVDGSLRKIKLDGADLSGANLAGADLRQASLVEASLHRADLQNARLDGADLSGANLSRADLRSAVLLEAWLEAADLRDAQVEDIQLVLAYSLTDAVMPDGKPYDGRFELDGDFRAALTDGIYRDQTERLVEWYGISLDDYQRGQDWALDNLEDLRVRARQRLLGPRDSWAAEMRESGELTDGSLRGENLEREDLSFSDLHDAVLPEANLEEADLSSADLRYANLRGANLAASTLQDADLTGADLGGADLSEADCRGAVFTIANLEGAMLDAALLDDADFKDAKVSDQQLVYADRLVGATMPDGSLYDGRYELLGDIEEALDNGIDIDKAEQFAHWYNIPVEAYEAGQKWARQHLARLRPEDPEPAD